MQSELQSLVTSVSDIEIELNARIDSLTSLTGADDAEDHSTSAPKPLESGELEDMHNLNGNSSI